MIRRQKLIGIIASVLLAAVGTGLLVAYVRSAENRALNGEETVEVLVVANTIPKGTKAEDITASLRLAQVPAKLATTGALTSTSPLAGKVASVDLLPGEQ
jgi:pilus assembly protein CpaB